MNRDHRGLLILLGVLVLVFLIGPLLGGGMMGQGMMWGHGPQGISGINGWAWGLTMALGLLSMFAFWGAIIVGVVLLVRWLVGTNAGSNDAQDPALETLRRRYAAGEVSHEEYDRMLEAIERRSSRDDRH
jgi:putative membrane protein